MRKYRAFTIAEIAIAMIIIMIISALAAQYFKPDTKKLKFFAYATIMNLQKGNSGVMSKYQTLNQVNLNSASCPANKFSLGCSTCPDGVNCSSCNGYFELVTDSVGGVAKRVCKDKFTDLISYIGISPDYDSYCLRLADNFTLKTAECKIKPAGDATINMRFANGATIQGLSTPWITPYSGSEYQYKNIVLDIDGEKGANKVWVDRVPLRIYSGGIANGTVMPVNCIEGQDIVYNKDTKVVLSGNNANPYCKQKWNASGAKAGKNFLIDNNVISYDIFRFKTANDESEAKLVLGGLSLMHANCKAYGETGVFHKNECASYQDIEEPMINKQSIRIEKNCVTEKQCTTCWKDSAKNTCPRTDAGADATDYNSCVEIQKKYNPENIGCFMLPHKPSVGASFIINGVLDGVDL